MNAPTKIIALSAVLLTLSPTAVSDPSTGYDIRIVATHGQATPGPAGGVFASIPVGWFTFQPVLSANGDVIFQAGVSTPEPGSLGLFQARHGVLTELTRTGQPVIGGGTLPAQNVPMLASANDVGDTVQVLGAVAPGDWFGLGAGVYRYRHSTGAVTPVMLSGVTPVPSTPGEPETTFAGAWGQTLGINNRGDLTFTGMVETPSPLQAFNWAAPPGMGLGIFHADSKGRLSRVAVPGDPAPGGSVFDVAYNSRMNDAGDVVFSGHRASDGLVDQDLDGTIVRTFGSSLFMWSGTTKQLRTLVRSGDPRPGGGRYDHLWSVDLNNRGEVIFTDHKITPPYWYYGDSSLYFLSRGTTTLIAQPGDVVPDSAGGGTIVTTAIFQGDNDLNNRGEVVFTATLDTDSLYPGIPDEAMYLWSKGNLRLVARTGTPLPDGQGAIAYLEPDYLWPPSEWGEISRDIWPVWSPLAWTSMNDRGQIAFQATLTDGRIVLLLATPRG